MYCISYDFAALLYYYCCLHLFWAKTCIPNPRLAHHIILPSEVIGLNMPNHDSFPVFPKMAHFCPENCPALMCLFMWTFWMVFIWPPRVAEPSWGCLQVRDPRSPPLSGTNCCACPLCVYVGLRLYTSLFSMYDFLSKKAFFCLTLKIVVLNLRSPCGDLLNILSFFLEVFIVQTAGSSYYDWLSLAMPSLDIHWGILFLINPLFFSINIR